MWKLCDEVASLKHLNPSVECIARLWITITCTEQGLTVMPTWAHGSVCLLQRSQSTFPSQSSNTGSNALSAKWHTKSIAQNSKDRHSPIHYAFPDSNTEWRVENTWLTDRGSTSLRSLTPQERRTNFSCTQQFPVFHDVYLSVPSRTWILPHPKGIHSWQLHFHITHFHGFFSPFNHSQDPQPGFSCRSQSVTLPMWCLVWTPWIDMNGCQSFKTEADSESELSPLPADWNKEANFRKGFYFGNNEVNHPTLKRNQPVHYRKYWVVDGILCKFSLFSALTTWKQWF